MKFGNKLVIIVGSAIGLGAFGEQAQAQTRTWRNAANGTFSAGANWVGGVAPGAGNAATFGLNASVNPFTAAFTGNATTAGLTVSNQRPTLNLGGFTYNVTGDTLIGGTNGPAVTLLNGTFNSRAGGGRLYIGRNAGQTGTLLVNGATLIGIAEIGTSGVGTLTIQNGATTSVASGDFAVIGYQAGSTGVLNITGAGSTLTQPDNTFHVGYLGDATCNILGGASVIAPRVVICDQGGRGRLLVDGGSSLSCPGGLEVGRASPQSDAALTVRGTGSTVSTGYVNTFGGGRGDIFLESGGRLSISGDCGTWGLGTRQNWTVNGAGSRLDAAQTFRVGNDGSQFSMLITNGGAANLNYLPLVGGTTASLATITVDGAASTLSTRFVQAEQGMLTLNVTGGASASMTEELRLGCCYVAGASTTNISGIGSTLRIGTQLIVGFETGGTHSMTVSAGGKLIGDEPGQNLNAYVGHRGRGLLTVTGPGSELRVKNRVHIGWYEANSNGTLTVTDGALAALGSLWMTGGNGSVTSTTVNGGSLMTLAQGVEVYEGSTLTIGTGSGIEAADGMNIVGTAARPGEVIVNDGGYLFVTGRIDLGSNLPNTGVGILTLNGGTAYCLDYVPVNDNGVIRGNGVLEGYVSVWGAIRPGMPIGTLSFSRLGFGDARGRLEIDIGGATPGTQYDQVVVTNALTAGGTLALSLANGFTPSIGQTFDIVTCASGQRSGQFASVVGTDLGNQKAFVVRYLADRVQVVVDGVTGVDIEQPSLSLYHGFTEPLSATATFSVSVPENVTAGVTWTSDDSLIATVSGDGKVKGIAPGSTMIRASYAGLSDAAPVTVDALPVPDGLTPGLDVEYRRVWWPRFQDLTPVLTEVRPSASVPRNPNWSQYGSLTVGDAYVAGSMTATLNVPLAGSYEFTSFDACGEARIFVNDKLVVYQRDATWYLGEWSGSIVLPAGSANLRIEYVKRGYYCGYGHQLDWRGPGMAAREEIPASAFQAPGVQLRYSLPPNPIEPSNLSEYDRSNYDVFVTDTVEDLDFPLNQYPGFTARFYSNTGAFYSGWLVAPATDTFTLRCEGFGIQARISVNGAPVGIADGAPIAVPLTQGLNNIEVDGFRPWHAQDELFSITIEGPGISRQAIPASAFWRGTPVPSCPADFNQDGGIDGADVDAFFVDWVAGAAQADVNQDGGVDGADVDEFFRVWSAGGCT